MADDLLGIALGSVIAGLVGLSAVWAQQRLERREWVKDKVLAPVFDYADKFLQDPWWLSSDPWPKFNPSDRLKVRPSIRRVIQKFSDTLAEYDLAVMDYANMRNANQSLLVPALQGAMAGYLTSDGQFPLGPLGLTGAQGVYVQTLYSHMYPYVLRHADDPGAAWAEMENSGEMKAHLLDRIIRLLREQAPNVLERIHTTLMSPPTTPKLLELVKVMDAKRKVALDRAREVKQLLEPKIA